MKLLEEGATIPFISRYRKEVTGALDEIQVAAVKDAFDKLTELATRSETVISPIDGLDNLTTELRTRIDHF